MREWDSERNEEGTEKQRNIWGRQKLDTALHDSCHEHEIAKNSENAGDAKLQAGKDRDCTNATKTTGIKIK